MCDKNIIYIHMILESEQRRLNAMLSRIDKVKDKNDLVLLEQGLELAEHYMHVARDMCKEVEL